MILVFLLNLLDSNLGIVLGLVSKRQGQMAKEHHEAGRKRFRYRRGESRAKRAFAHRARLRDFGRLEQLVEPDGDGRRPPPHPLAEFADFNLR